MPDKIVYALDFDGVICDSALETGLSGWKAAQRIWSVMPEGDAPEALIQQFREIRPYQETGYEAILMMRQLYLGMPLNNFFGDFRGILQSLVEGDALDIAELKILYGGVRDQWIQQDEAGWLSKSPLYEGMAEQMGALADSVWYLVTTKQERFARRILHNNGIIIPDERVFGLDRQMNKQQVLAMLVERHPESQLIFVEDRLRTLQDMAFNPALVGVRRQLVDWGYNTVEDRESAVESGIELISREEFLLV